VEPLERELATLSRHPISRKADIRMNERYWQGNVQMSAHLERLTLLRARRGLSLDPLKATA
jgi:hypothetical protein